MKTMTVADTIRRTIERRELSLYSVCKASGVPYQTVHAFAKHGRDIRLSSADRICKALGLRLIEAEGR